MAGISQSHRRHALLAGGEVLGRSRGGRGEAFAARARRHAVLRRRRRRPADLCVSLVTRCDLYIGIIGTRYGSPVRDDPERSYTELEFDTATALGKRRLVFLIDETAVTAAANAGDRAAAAALPSGDPWAARQAVFRQRLLDSGCSTAG